MPPILPRRPVRDRLRESGSTARAVLLGADALALHAGVSTVVVHVLAVLATIAFTVYRPTHSALLPRSVQRFAGVLSWQ